MPYLIRAYQGSSHTKILETYSKLEMRDAEAAAQDGRRPVKRPKVKPEDELKTEPKSVEVTIPIVDLTSNDLFLPTGRVFPNYQL